MLAYDMLTLRAGQIAIMAQPMIEHFRAKAAEHLRRHFPEQCEALGEEALSGAVVHGLERAVVHGFERESDLLKYLNLCFTFGRDFDTREDLEWAAPILSETGSEPSELMDRLYDAAVLNEDEGEGYWSAQDPSNDGP